MGEIIKDAGRAVARLYPMGLSMLWKAPLVLALVIVPEFLQHIVEIHLGMFASKASFNEHSLDTLRMVFGGLKVAGLLLAIFASARFWWTARSGPGWYDPRGMAWDRFSAGFLLFMILPAAPTLLKSVIGDTMVGYLELLLTIAMLPGLFILLSGLMGDRNPTARDYWIRSWPWALLMALLLVLAFWPAQWIHSQNHTLAIGSPLPMVWALMVWDALLVGLLAGLTGTALYLGYAAFARRRAD